METASSLENLLEPISDVQPAGEDLRWTPEWDRIKEARRADDPLETGKWAKRERKIADWLLVKELACGLLRDRSKDLQLALWLTEAEMKLRGFPGLRDGFRLTRELLTLYWDIGLYPKIEDGPEDRSGPLQWLNDKLVDSVTALAITARAGGGQNYSFDDLQDARRVGSEANYRNADGDIDTVKKKAYDAAVAAGRPSLDIFERTIRECPRAAYEEFSAEFLAAHEEFKALEKVIDAKFGDAAPNLSACRNTLNEMKQAVSDILQKKRAQEPDAPAPTITPTEPSAGNADPMTVRFPIAIPSFSPSFSMSQTTDGSGSWHDAEMLIRSGQVDKGLAEMTRLAANETSGRSRFQRKLLLAEVCLASQRDRLARSILEELAEIIDKNQLENWESSELIGSVWIRLYRLYKTDSGDADRAGKLYLRLCRLDPWQALLCSES